MNLLFTSGLLCCFALLLSPVQLRAAEGSLPLAYSSVQPQSEPRPVKALDAADNPYRERYSAIDRWIVDHALTQEQLAQRKPSNEWPLIAYVDNQGFLIPWTQAAEESMFVRYNTALIGEHKAFPDYIYRFAALGEMDESVRSELEQGRLAIRSQYYPQFPGWLVDLTDDHILVTLDESKPYPGNPTDWKSWMEMRGAEKQADGSWKVWTLDSAVPLSDGSWVVTTIYASPAFGSEPMIASRFISSDAGMVRPVSEPFPGQVFGAQPNRVSYCFVDNWRTANGLQLTPQRQNTWNTWMGMFDAYVEQYEASQTDPRFGPGLNIHYEYLVKQGTDGMPKVIYHLLDGKVYDADDPSLRKQITLPGRFFGQEISRQDLLELHNFRQAQQPADSPSP